MSDSIRIRGSRALAFARLPSCKARDIVLCTGFRVVLGVQASGERYWCTPGARPRICLTALIRARRALKGRGDGLPTPGPTPSLREGVEHLEDGALIGRGALPPSADASGGRPFCGGPSQ